MEDHIKKAFASKILNIKDFFEEFSIRTAEDGEKILKKHLQKLMFMSKPKGISEWASKIMQNLNNVRNK